MPWKHNGKEIREGRSWAADDGTQHPADWMRWSDSEKKAKGLTWENAPASESPFDYRFYWGRQTDGTLIERSLADINEVDENKKPILDEDGNQVVTKGLKKIWIEKTKEKANNLLSSSDWMITRKAEKGTAIPDATTTYRDSVRTACNTIETKINDCSSLTDFMKLFDAPSDGSNPPIFDFPSEE